MRTFLSFCFMLPLFFSVAFAATYQIPGDNSKTVGEVSIVTAKAGDTLSRIAVRNGVGYNEILRANPKLKRRKLRVGTQVIVPSAYVLPDVDYQGIVINLSAMRLYYFPNRSTVMTYPVAIGKRGWNTPKGYTEVVAKHRRPTWTPPPSIIREAAKKGRKLKKVYPAGPNNPLGTRALRLGMPGYLIHGTNKPWTIGQRRSHGCIRMRRHDVEDLFERVVVGTPVRIISQHLPLAKLPDLPEQELLADTNDAAPKVKRQRRAAGEPAPVVPRLADDYKNLTGSTVTVGNYSSAGGELANDNLFLANTHHTDSSGVSEIISVPTNNVDTSVDTSQFISTDYPAGNFTGNTPVPDNSVTNNFSDSSTVGME